MKFGKRLLAEAERQWQAHYIDYKALKSAIKADVAAADPHGPAFERAIRTELHKVAQFYTLKEEQLGASVETLGAAPPEAVAAFRADVKHLRKYVVLNYICVVKATKKRNRHLKAVCGDLTVSLRAVDILSLQYFFTSSKLASIATQAEVLAKALQPVTEQMLEEYQCPICLNLLRGAVVLTCAHRFCWGCLVAHCTTVLGRLAAAGDAGEAKEPKEEERGAAVAVAAAAGPAVLVPAWEGEHSDDEPATLATFDCPVCRKAQLLDLDRLHVDPHLDAFVRKLEGQEQQQVVVEVPEAAEPCSQSQEAEPMAVDSPQPEGTSTPVQRPVPISPPTSGGAPVLSVSDMDAVLEYLHKEHRALEAERQALAARRQQEQKQVAAADPSPRPPVPLGLQRSASQPLAISTPSAARGSQQRGEAAAMEVDTKPSSRRALLAASAEPQQAASAFGAAAMPAAVPAPAASAPSPPCKPPAAPAPAAAPGPLVLLEQPCAQGAAPAGEPPLLPPQRPEHRGKLVVCLDLDGTLVSTFTPKRAPVLPSTAVSYVVGRGGKLNPGGVFVVERPGLREFFARISPVAEVVLFTAGLEDYAKPICDALESQYGNVFTHRLYRPACVPDEVYPCVKDMARLGRDLQRCVLVDDTPLAFVRQPDNGVPVLQFRGDIDDRLLSEAVAPLIESLAGVKDVRGTLSRRFNMTKWFQAQGLLLPKAPPAHLHMHRAPSMPALPNRPSGLPSPEALRQAQHVQHAQHAPSGVEVLQQRRTGSGTLLMLDFDRTVIEYDAGERVTDELAPELTSLLSSLEMPSNFVPVTNTVLAEMQRRGVSRDKLLHTLRAMGQEVPLASVRMLQWASRTGIDVRIISDCNSVFISHILTGARVNSCVREVITNFSSFQRVEEPQQQQQQEGASHPGSWLQRAFGAGGSSGTHKVEQAKAVSQRLVITPRHDYHHSHHGCPLCPENLCKGQELEAVWAARGRPRRTIYAGDGVNDACPALRLGPDDVLLARKGYGLEAFIAKRAGAPDGVRRVMAQVHLWSSHEELWTLVQEAACC